MNKVKNNIILILILASTVSFAQPAFKKIINLPNTGLVEDIKRIGPNRVLMTFSVYAYITDTMGNFVTGRNITGVPTYGYPRVGSTRVKDGIIMGYTNASYGGVTFYKFKQDLSSFTAATDCGFGQPSGLSNTFDSKSFIEDTTTKVATFVGGRSNCAEVITCQFDSALNVVNPRTMFYIAGNAKYICFDYDATSLYVLHNDVSNANALVAKTNYGLNVKKAFSFIVADSLTQSCKMIKTSDNKLLIAGKYWFKGQSNTKFFLMKCDSVGNVDWCKNYSLPSTYMNFANTLCEANGKYFAGGDTPSGGLILEVDPATGALTNYNAQTIWVVSITKIGNRIFTCTNDWAIPTFYVADGNPMKIASSCTNTAYTINTTPLTPSITSVSPSQFFVTSPWAPGSTMWAPVNMIITNSVSTTCQTSVGVDEVTFNKEQLLIYPNPASHDLNIRSFSSISKLVLTNSIGQKVLERNVDLEETSLDLSGLNAGIYFVEITNGEGTLIRKIVKE
jgi:hypothetical protein